MSPARIRRARSDDREAAYRVCLLTGDAGQDGTPLYGADPDALGRLFVGPYLALEPALALVLEDDQGVCGYTLGALDSRTFYARYDAEWRPDLCARFPAPTGDPAGWTPLEQVYGWYHQADYTCPEPYEQYPSHLHIDLLPRAQGQGHGRAMMNTLMDLLGEAGSPGVHLGLWARNTRAYAFYRRLGFDELTRTGETVYMGKTFTP